jgi:hypothetical protein
MMCPAASAADAAASAVCAALRPEFVRHERVAAQDPDVGAAPVQYAMAVREALETARRAFHDARKDKCE